MKTRTTMRVILAGVALVVGSSAAGAQSPCASAAVQVKDVCRKAADLVGFMTPQLSTALVGGNPTLGQGGALGGLGHFSIDIRGSAVNGSVPKLTGVTLSTAGEQPSTFTSENKIVPAASLDAAVGVWKGLSLGVTHVGGIDGILTATYLPNVNDNNGAGDVSFKVNGSNWKVGYGVRVGLLEEGVAWPGVSFVWAKRDLPSVSATGTIAAQGLAPQGTLALNDYSVKTTAWRLTAAKNLLVFGLSAGYGQDKYDATSTVVTHVDATLVTPAQNATVSVPVPMTRSNFFVGAAINLIIFKIEGEYGSVSGGTVPSLLNRFGAGDANVLANKSRSYFTVGLRFGM